MSLTMPMVVNGDVLCTARRPNSSPIYTPRGEGGEEVVAEDEKSSNRVGDSTITPSPPSSSFNNTVTNLKGSTFQLHMSRARERWLTGELPNWTKKLNRTGLFETTMNLSQTLKSYDNKKEPLQPPSNTIDPLSFPSPFHSTRPHRPPTSPIRNIQPQPPPSSTTPSSLRPSSRHNRAAMVRPSTYETIIPRPPSSPYQNKGHIRTITQPMIPSGSSTTTSSAASTSSAPLSSSSSPPFSSTDSSSSSSSLTSPSRSTNLTHVRILGAHYRGERFHPESHVPKRWSRGWELTIPQRNDEEEERIYWRNRHAGIQPPLQTLTADVIRHMPKDVKPIERSTIRLKKKMQPFFTLPEDASSHDPTFAHRTEQLYVDKNVFTSIRLLSKGLQTCLYENGLHPAGLSEDVKMEDVYEGKEREFNSLFPDSSFLYERQYSTTQRDSYRQPPFTNDPQSFKRQYQDSQQRFTLRQVMDPRARNNTKIRELYRYEMNHYSQHKNKKKKKQEES